MFWRPDESKPGKYWCDMCRKPIQGNKLGDTDCVHAECYQIAEDPFRLVKWLRELLDAGKPPVYEGFEEYKAHCAKVKKDEDAARAKATAVKKRPGRPPGAKNKPKDPETVTSPHGQRSQAVQETKK